MVNGRDSFKERPTDRTLVLLTRQGDTEAFGQLVRRHQTSVFNVCYRLFGERRDAEDLTQETFIRAYRRLETFDEHRPFGPWIRRVAANLCYNHLARNRPVLLPFEEGRHRGEEKSPVTPEMLQEVSERAGVVRAAILKLSPPYRAVIELRHFQGLSYKEIADTLNTSLSQVKSHLFRARKQLAEMIGEDLG